jgi:predicted MFS family arabinose efflux permease
MISGPVAVNRTVSGAGTRLRDVAVRGWLAGGVVYLTGVFHRTSLGVAGLTAEHRFHISPAQLSVFLLLQLGVYAAMQVPTGVLVDRYGPRRLLVTAAVVMATAQLIFAFAPTYPVALLARALLGCGDALTFVSVLRFAAVNFSPRRYPVVVAITTLFGFAGNMLATVPLTVLLRQAGWTPTFAGAGLVSVAAALAVLILMPRTRTAAHAQPRRRAESGDSAWSRVRSAWATPGTRLGFWVHFSCMSAAAVFGVLWGLPYLVSQGFSSSSAGAVLLLSVVVCVVASVSIGALIATRPAWRVPAALGISVVTVVGWTLLLSVGGDHPPAAVVTVLVAIMSIGGPASSIGFAIARDYNRASIVGTATGIVNVGGFFAAILGATAIGLVLQVLGNSGPGAFRLAFATAIGIQLVGTVQVVRWWLRVRAFALHHQSQGREVPVAVIRRSFDFTGVRASALAAATQAPPVRETSPSR